MKYLAVAFLTSFVSVPAFADYFGCELTVNFRRVSEEAEYMGRQVSVAKDGFTCEGTIDNDGRFVTAILRSGFSGTVRKATGIHRATAQLEELGWEFEGSFSEVSCDCSRN